MRMQNLLKANNKIKKSHILLFGSLLIFIGFLSLSWNYLIRMKDEIYSDMKIAMMDTPVEEELAVEVVTDVPITENVNMEENNTNYVIDYSKYLGVLEIPKIGLKRGFYNVGSKYNSIEYNVTMVDGSTMPDVPYGNLILMAHSGDAYISYFAYLYKLEIGNQAFITYQGNRYTYQIVNIYNVPKVGVVSIVRDYNKTCLTLITCTKDSDSLQTVYILEQV